MKQNLKVDDDFYRLRAVLKGWNAPKIAENLISKHTLQGRKSAILIKGDEVLFYSQRGKKRWNSI